MHQCPNVNVLYFSIASSHLCKNCSKVSSIISAECGKNQHLTLTELFQQFTVQRLPAQTHNNTSATVDLGQVHLHLDKKKLLSPQGKAFMN